MERRTNPLALLIALLLATLVPPAAPASGTAEAPRTSTFAYEGVVRVQVLNAEVYAIEITGSAGEDLSAEVRAPADSKVGIEHRRSGGTVMIRAYRRERLFGGLGSTQGQYLLVLRVPRDCELEIRTATGSISVSDVRGPKELETDTGSIDLKGCDGETAATTQTGSHSYTSVRGDIAAKADTGGIALSQVEGALSVETNTGRIEGTGLRLTGHSSFSADTGSIVLELDQSLDDFSFELRSDTGKIVVGETEARGRLVLGGGRIRLKAETDTGGVRIQGR